MIKNIIQVSDLHCGCQFGLCPDEEIPLDGGGNYLPSPFQKIVWNHWREFWNEWVPRVTKNEDYIIVLNGDAMDGTHHNSTTQISQNMADQKKIFIRVWEEVLGKRKCQGYYHIRGTEAHAGKSAEYEEDVAREMKAFRSENGNYSRDELRLKFGDRQTMCHFTHHVGCTGSANYESTALWKEMIDQYVQSGRWSQEPPQILGRAHRHQEMHIEQTNSRGYGIVFVSPGWQLRTPFSYAIGNKASVPQLGGYLIREGDEDVFVRCRVWDLQTAKIETI